MADTAALRPQSDYDSMVVARTMRRFSEFQTWRNTTASHWEEIAELIDPPSRNTFFFQNFNWPGQKKSDRQVDATGMMALERFAAIMDSLVTPRNQVWQHLRSADDYVMKDRQTRLWYTDTTRKLFRYRYAAAANFTTNNNSIFRSLGAYGTAAMYIDDNFVERGLRYKAVPIGELFFGENHQGTPNEVIRWWRMTARQIKEKWPDSFPANLQGALDKGSEYKYEILHHVYPNDDYEAGRLDRKGKRFHSCYVQVESRALLGEGGYRKFPYAVSRYVQTAGEIYGRSPAMMVLPGLKTLNAEKKVFLKQGHRAGDPVLLTADDGLIDPSLEPGALNKGGMSPDGKPLIGVLPSGNIQITKEMMDEERSLVNDAFLVSLFQILTESSQMTATEVIERTNEKGILIAPTAGRQDCEYVGPMTDRELDLLAYQGLLLPMPPRLREARGEYESVSTSPLAKAAKAGEASGFLRTLESAKEIVQITGDTSVFDPFNFDAAMRGIADIQSVPEDWMASDDDIRSKRQNRAQAQQQKDQIQAMPAQAAMIKANAVAAKNGAQAQQPQGQPQPGGQQGVQMVQPGTMQQ